MYVDYSALWDPRSGGKILDHTLLVDTSGKMWRKRDYLLKAVNDTIPRDYDGSSKNRYITILSFGEELNVHRYMQYIDEIRLIERGEWSDGKVTALYDALIAAIKMAHKRVGALANDGKAEIEITVFSEGKENSSESTKEDLKVVLESALNSRGVWDINLGLPQHKNTSIEEFFDFKLSLEPCYVESKDRYNYWYYKHFQAHGIYERSKDFVDETGLDELEELEKYFSNNRIF